MPKPKTDRTGVSVELCVGKDALTADKAKSLLGWMEVKHNNHLLKDVGGNRVVCERNPNNRPLDKSVYRTWMSEILNRRWRLNGETMIFDTNGNIIDAQHRLVALVLAGQEWTKDPEQWPLWEAEPTMDCILVYGIDASDETVNTIDTGKPRSLTDVIYRSDLFAKLPPQERKAVSNIAASACKMLGHRTAAWVDAFAPRRTHSELIEFLDRHPKLLDCVRHVYEEDGKDKRIYRYLATGYVAALMYLMGSCASSPTEYFRSPNEDLLDWKYWDQASNFVVHLAQGTDDTKPLRAALAKYREKEEDSVRVKAALLVKAWNRTVVGKSLSIKTLDLTFHTMESGERVLTEYPTLGGIDVGGQPYREEDEEYDKPNGDPDESEVQKLAKQQKGKTRVGKMRGDAWADGDLCWVREEDGEHYFGKVIGQPWKTDGGESLTMVEADDGKWEVRLPNLFLRRPPKPAT